jgi:hypothetical protein
VARRLKLRTWLHLAWSAVATGGILLEVLTPASTNPEDWQWPFGLAVFPFAGALVLIRRPGNKVGLLLAVVGAAAGFLFSGGWVAVTWPDHALSRPLESLVTAAVLVTFWGIVGLVYVFPTGEARPGWSRWAFRFFSVGLLGVAPLLFLLRPGPMDITGRDNPFGVDVDWLPALADQLVIVLPIGAVLGVVSLFVRLRRSEGVERAQLKVFLMGAAFVLGLVAIITVLPEVGGGLFDGLARVAVIVGFWALPTAIVAAILRYRLYDIDRLVSRTVTYVAALAMLGVGYAGLVVLLRGLLPLQGDLPVAMSTLVVASLFLPLVRRVQRLVDRRFFRSRYDTSAVVSSFASELRHSLDVDRLTDRTAEVVRATFEPEEVGVWLARND